MTITPQNVIGPYWVMPSDNEKAQYTLVFDNAGRFTRIKDYFTQSEAIEAARRIYNRIYEVKS